MNKLSNSEIDEILKNVPAYSNYTGIRSVTRVIHCGDLARLNQTKCVYIGRVSFNQDITNSTAVNATVQPDTTTINQAINQVAFYNGGGFTYTSPQDNGVGCTLLPSFNQYTIIATSFPVCAVAASFEGYMVQLK